jgi:hypothetical protein
MRPNSEGPLLDGRHWAGERPGRTSAGRETEEALLSGSASAQTVLFCDARHSVPTNKHDIPAILLEVVLSFVRDKWPASTIT